MSPFWNARSAAHRPLRRPIEGLGLASAATFLGTAGLGALVAPDPAAAATKLALIGGGFVLAAVLAVSARTHRDATPRLAACLCGVTVIGIAAGGLLSAPAERGSAASALMILTPLAASVGAPRRRHWMSVETLCALAAIVGATALVASGDGAAIAALAGGALCATGLLRRPPAPLTPRAPSRADSLALFAVGSGVAGYLALILSPGVRDMAARVWGRSAMARPELWHDSLVMLRDYGMTGMGLGDTAMTMSSYLWLLHVPFHPHVHNLYLQIGLEQGIAGLAAFVGLLVTAASGLVRACRACDPRMRPTVFAAATSLLALGLYGLVESDLYYGSAVWCLPLPFAFAAVVAPRRRARLVIGDLVPGMLVAAGLVVLVTALASRASVRAQIQANLGALDQTRAEMSVYRWPEWPIQDALRRKRPQILGRAVTYYRAALALDPSNETAHRRLGQILLSLGQYEDAVGHLERARVAAPSARVTQRLLGEACAVTGQVERARSLWVRAGARRDALDGRLWWYRHVGDAVEAARLEQAIEAFDAPRAMGS